MKKCFKKALSGILASAMLFSSVAFTPVSVSAASMTAGGWFETIYAEIPGLKDTDVTAVSYSGTMSGSLTGDDFEYLVRDDSNGVRIDIPGLTAGTYNLTVTTSSGTLTQNNITVYEYDRAGFAHKDNESSTSIGVGAYKNDGTLKDNAVVVYVTEENKNTVQLPGYEGDSYPKGIGNILNYKSEDANGVTGGGKTDVIKYFRENNIPLVVRFLGTVEAGDENTKGSAAPSENILGLTAYNSTTNGGTVKDNGMVARIYKASNITFEGIGTDATIDGWGFQVISQTGFVSENFEFRNFTFTNTPEDAIGLEGTASLSASPQSKEWLDTQSPIKNCWVHNNTFETGYCYNPAESDKGEGDGSVDFKRGYGYTLSYNHFHENHKTNLVGSSKQSIQYDVTFHHNYYEGVWSRQPLARHANIHIYNSYFKNGENTSYIISPRAYSYIFTEGNFFDGCKNPVDAESEGGGTVVKSLNDNFAGCTGNNYAQIVDSKNTVISSTNPYAGFEYSSDMYDYTVTDAAQAKADCLAKAGAMPEVANINMDPQPEAVISQYPSSPIALPYEVDFTDATVVAAIPNGQTTDYNNALITPSAKLATSTGMKIRDNGIVFTVNTDVDITIALGSKSSYGLDIVDEYGVAVKHFDSSGTVSGLEAGTYIIRSGNVVKDAYVESIKIVQNDPNGTTVEVSTQATTSSSETTTKSSSGGDGDTETTTSSSTPISGSYMMHEDAVDASGDDIVAVKSAIYDFTGTYKNAEGTYNGITYDKGYKMESSTVIEVDAPSDGTLQIVSAHAGNIKIDGTEYALTSSSDTLTLTEIPLTAGNHKLSRGSSELWIYLLNFIPDGSDETTEVTTSSSSGSDDTTVTTTETTTEATTTATTEATTEATTVATTEATTESTTEAPEPVDDVNITVGGGSVNAGTIVTVPVRVSGLASLANYNFELSYDSSKLQATGVANGDIIDVTDDTFSYNINEPGVVKITAVNTEEIASGDTLFNVTFTALEAGTTEITLTVNELFAEGSVSIGYNVSNGKVTVIDGSTPSTGIPGDVNKDGKVDAQDAAIVLKIVSGAITDTSAYDIAAADCDGNAGITVLDAVWILNNKSDGTVTNKDFYDFEDSPAVTKDGTSGITYTVSTSSSAAASDGLTAVAEIVDNNGSKALYLNDQSATDTVKATLPLTEISSGTATYQVTLTPTVTGSKWTMVMFNGLKSDGTVGEVLGVRTSQDTGNPQYGLRVSGSGEADVISNVTTAANTPNTLTIVVDFDNDRASISVDGSDPVTVVGFTGNSITSMAFQTATGVRSLYVDNAGLVSHEEGATEATTESTTAGGSDENTETTTEAVVSGGSWTAGDASTPSWLNLNGASSTSNNNYNAFAQYNNGDAFANFVSISNGGEFTITPTSAGKIKVYIAANNNAAGKGTVTATYADSTTATYSLPARRDDAATPFELTVTAAQVGQPITFTVDYNSMLFKVEM